MTTSRATEAGPATPPGPDSAQAPTIGAAVAAGPGTPATTPLIRNRDFQALWTSESFAAIAKEAAEISYPLLILAVTGHASWAGAIGSAQLVTASFMSIPGGALVDRFDRRRVLAVCNLVRVTLLGGLSLLILAGFVHLYVIFAVAICSALCLGVSQPAGLAAIKQLVPPEQVTPAIAQNQIRFFGATVVGPPIGGALFGVARAFPFFFSAASFLTSALLLLLIRKPTQAMASTRNSKKGAAEGFRFILSQPVLLWSLIWIMASNMAFNHTGVFVGIAATGKSRGASDALIGLTVAIAGGGGLFGSFVAAWVLKHVRPSLIMFYGAWIGPIAAIGLANVHGVVGLGFWVATIFIRGPIISALFLAYVAKLASDQLQGRVLGAVFFCSMIVQPIGILGIGVLFDAAGAGAVFTTMAVIGVLAALPTLTPFMRHLPTPDEMTEQA
jgi:predicted MFS family arabinose efflux permease